MERNIAELKMQGLGKARYRGSRKNLLQLRPTAGLVDGKMLFTLEMTSPTHEPCRWVRIRTDHIPGGAKSS